MAISTESFQIGTHSRLFFNNFQSFLLLSTSLGSTIMELLLSKRNVFINARKSFLSEANIRKQSLLTVNYDAKGLCSVIPSVFFFFYLNFHFYFYQIYKHNC